jgi:uncharacterized membrane protein YesL
MITTVKITFLFLDRPVPILSNTVSLASLGVLENAMERFKSVTERLKTLNIA